MRVILLQPYFDSHIVTPPLSLGYLAGFLRARKGKHQIEILDCNAFGLGLNSLLAIIKNRNPDIIAVTVLTNFFAEAKEAILRIKELSSVKVVVGGPHVTALPEFTLRQTGADFAIVGEGECTMAELLEFLESGSTDLPLIDGLYYRRNGEIVTNSPRKLIDDINALPFPAWDLLKPEKYPPAPHGAFYKRFPVAPIITTRGCPYSCEFCSSSATWGNKIRMRTPDSVVTEMQYLYRKHNVREFHFEDDNFTISREHALSICEEIIRRKLKIVWAAPNGVRIDSLDRELILTLRRSGCYLLAFGIESGSQPILNRMNKRLDLEKVRLTLEMVNKYGIETWGFFIIGLPGETRESIEETIRLSKSLPLNRAQFCNFTPLPGTQIFKDWTAGLDLSQIEWHKLSFSGEAVFNSEELTVKELTLLQKRAFREFYFRPKIFFSTLFKIRLRQIKWIFKRMKSYSYFQRD